MSMRLAVAPAVIAVLLSATLAETQRRSRPELPMSQQAFRVNEFETNRGLMYEAATAASLAYTTTPHASTGWVQYSIKRPAVLFGDDQTVVLLRKDSAGKLIELAVRGTSTLDDALRDLNQKAVLDGDLDVPLHSGFREIALGVLAFLRDHVTKQEFDEYDFRLFGHSLGGAVASIVAMYLHQSGKRVAAVVTFGAPRFTTNAGARKYQVLNEQTLRVVRCDDVVPFLPPPNFFGWTTGGYEANGNVLLLLKPPYFDFSRGMDIERDFTHQLRSELGNSVNRIKLAFGHRMQNYETLLKAISVGLRAVSYQLSEQTALCPAQLVDGR